MKNLVLVYWIESERGWGQRPDGLSLHLTEEDKKKYEKEYWSKMPDGPAPDEYSRPEGSKTINVTDELYNKVEEKGGSWRIWQHKVAEELKKVEKEEFFDVTGE